MHGAQAAADRGQELDRRPESVTVGFVRVVRPGPLIGELGRAVIADAGLGGRLAATPCPYGDGTASDRITAIARRYLEPALTGAAR